MTKALPDHAGVRSFARARSTGTHVGIYDGFEAGLDTDGGRWSIVCDEHGGVISLDTLATAKAWAPHPEDWCPYCMGEIPID